MSDSSATESARAISARSTGKTFPRVEEFHPTDPPRSKLRTNFERAGLNPESQEGWPISHPRFTETMWSPGLARE